MRLLLTGMYSYWLLRFSTYLEYLLHGGSKISLGAFGPTNS